MQGIEDIYRHHHSTKRGVDFVVLGEERGAFLKENIGTGKKVLDIGCRDGELTKYFAEGNEVLGVDVDKVALARAEEKLGIKTLHIDLNSSWDEIPKNHFDVVVAAEIIEHLYYPEIVLKKIQEVLKPGGILLGTVPNAFSLKTRIKLFFLSKKNTALQDPTHINHFTVVELQEKLRSVFVEVKIFGFAKRVSKLARVFPQMFAHSLFFTAKKEKSS